MLFPFNQVLADARGRLRSRLLRNVGPLTDRKFKNAFTSSYHRLTPHWSSYTMQ